jgi:hypothetical protein
LFSKAHKVLFGTDRFLVTVPPQILPFMFGEESVNAGDVAAVQCTVVKGDFPIQISWLFNDTEVNLDGVFVSKNSKRVAALTIEAVRAHHAGDYTCLARNAAGSANHTAVLRVNGQLMHVFNHFPYSIHGVSCTLSFSLYPDVWSLNNLNGTKLQHSHL